MLCGFGMNSWPVCSAHSFWPQSVTVFLLLIYCIDVSSSAGGMFVMALYACGSERLSLARKMLWTC